MLCIRFLMMVRDSPRHSVAVPRKTFASGSHFLTPFQELFYGALPLGSWNAQARVKIGNVNVAKSGYALPMNAENAEEKAVPYLGTLER
ncbi:hypothetical protein VTN02DRAFT_6493 [Thermoascus thermophilus]